MSNILIIKHGSLGDIVQISGVLKDLRAHHKDKKIFILTTTPYIELLSSCPYVDVVLQDKRLPRWNINYLLKLKRMINKYNFTHLYDLQNSSRTSFYRKYLFKIPYWSSTETILKRNKRENLYKDESVLNRFKYQLENSNIDTKHSLKPDFSWAATNVKNLIEKFTKKRFVLLFPFCSPQLSHKKWPYYNELIKMIVLNHPHLDIVIVPGPQEIIESKKINSISIIKDNNTSLNIKELAGVILESSYVISNDTGPAHMVAHLGKEGLVLFGHHTTAKKVSIETNQFKALSVNNLSELSADQVYSEIKDKIKLIN